MTTIIGRSAAKEQVWCDSLGKNIKKGYTFPHHTLAQNAFPYSMFSYLALLTQWFKIVDLWNIMSQELTTWLYYGKMLLKVKCKPL